MKPTEELLREAAPPVLGALLRRYGTEQLEVCEDAVSEAMLEAYRDWPERGVPANPTAWLITSSRRRLIDRIRSDSRRREREIAEARLAHPLAELASAGRADAADDSLEMLMLCCHPELTQSQQVALTLRAVGGLSTAQIARAYLLPEATIGQRISRAKAKIRDSGAEFGQLGAPAGRLEPVLTVLYLMFTEGHTSTAGDRVDDVDLAAEAIRLTRMLHAAVEDDAETAGLLALMLLTAARRAARIDDRGMMIGLDEQDRTRWDRAMITEGLQILHRSLPGREPSPYLIQAAIAALHAEAPSTEETDWPQILVLYKVLEQLTGNPMVTLNRAVAEAMVHGPAAGLAVVDQLAGDRLAADNHRLLAVRAHLLERSGDPAASEVYLEASRRTASIPEREYLRERARRSN